MGDLPAPDRVIPFDVREGVRVPLESIEIEESTERQRTRDTKMGRGIDIIGEGLTKRERERKKEIDNGKMLLDE